MRYILSINTPCVRLSVKLCLLKLHSDLHEEKVSNIYSANLRIHVEGLDHLRVCYSYVW